MSAISSGLTPCAVTETGRLYCWGYGTAGEVGDGGTEDRLVPTRVSAGTMGFDPARVRQVVGIAGHSCALTEDRRAFCWGRNSRGQLGVGTVTPYELTPVLVGPASAEG